MPRGALIGSRRDDRDLTKRAQCLCQGSQPWCANAIIIGDEDVETGAKLLGRRRGKTNSAPMISAQRVKEAHRFAI